MVIPASFKSAHPFQEGLARVGLGDNQQAFINRQGQVVIPGPFEIAEDFKNGLEGRNGRNGVSSTLPERFPRDTLRASRSVRSNYCCKPHP
jgi:hypothetical protein